MITNNISKFGDFINSNDFANIDIRDAYFDKIYNIASIDKNVIFMTADADAFSLRKFKKDFPHRFINVGVAEQNMITVASGLALSGKKVFIYAIIPFVTMRCYEHIKTNICGMNLPVTIIGSGSGLSFGNDGPTHHAIQDISIMRTLPEMTILNPSDSTLSSKCAQLSYESKTPVYVRLDKGTFPDIYNENDDYTKGLKIIRKLSDINIISTGYMTHQSIKVSDILKKCNDIDVGVIDIYRIKQINKDLLINFINSSKIIITFEENSIIGGLGTIISEIVTDYNINIILKRIAIEDTQCFNYGSREWLHKKYMIDIDNTVNTIKNIKMKYCDKNEVL